VLNGRFWDHVAGLGPQKSFQSPDFQAFFGRSAAAQAIAERQLQQAKPVCFDSISGGKSIGPGKAGDLEKARVENSGGTSDARFSFPL
jgi:hypothetical protein